MPVGCPAYGSRVWSSQGEIKNEEKCTEKQKVDIKGIILVPVLAENSQGFENGSNEVRNHDPVLV